MDSPKSYRVGIRRKIPYLTNLFLITAGLCFLAILVFDFLFSPFKNAPQEIQIAIFYWIVPDFWKKVLAFSVFGFCGTVMIYALLRYYKHAILLFNDKTIFIRAKAFNMIIPVNTINKIYCNDAYSSTGNSRKKLSITIELKRKNKAITIRLKNYNEADEFMEKLMMYEGLELKFYSFYLNPTHSEEE